MNVRRDVFQALADPTRRAILLLLATAPAIEQLTDDTSKLTMHIVYRSVADRDQMLKLPFTQGINWTHNRLQDIVSRFTLTQS